MYSFRDKAESAYHIYYVDGTFIAGLEQNVCYEEYNRMSIVG